MSGLDLSRSYEMTRQWRILHYSHGRGLSSTCFRIIREVLPAFCVYLISSFKKIVLLLLRRMKPMAEWLTQEYSGRQRAVSDKMAAGQSSVTFSTPCILFSFHLAEWVFAWLSIWDIHLCSVRPNGILACHNATACCYVAYVSVVLPSGVGVPAGMRELT